MLKHKNNYDLVERTSKFAEKTLDFLKGLEKSDINKPLLYQITKSATSVGANYMEADVAQSKKDFIHKISICRKESKETMYWIRIIAHANPGKKEECRPLYLEAEVFVKIFSKILAKSKQ